MEQVQAFRRPLYASELATVDSLLADPRRRGGLWELAAKEFDWALTVNGHVSGKPGRVDFTSALTALRQLAYLNGLPSLNNAAAKRLLESCAGPVCAGVACQADISAEEFKAAVGRLLEQALAASLSS